MKIEVGMSLRWQGRDVICSSTRHDRETKFASESSEEVKKWLTDLLNCTYMQLEIDEFKQGDVVDVEYQRVELQVPGHHIFYLYPYYKVKLKESENGREGDSSIRREASDCAPQGTGEGA